MGKALHAELQKARRRHDLLICLAVPVVVYLWAGAQAPTGADELANAYSALLYALPVLNAVLMPIVMALIASRLWDMEVKGSTTKLLYTLQSRRSLFAGKALLGTGEVLLMVTLEMGWGGCRAIPRRSPPGRLCTRAFARWLSMSCCFSRSFC